MCESSWFLLHAWVTFLLDNSTKSVTVLTTEEPHLTALATSIKQLNYDKVSNIIFSKSFTNFCDMLD